VGYSVVKNLLKDEYTGPVVFVFSDPMTWSPKEVAHHNSHRREYVKYRIMVDPGF
jgi:hypothetical protein